MRLRHRNSYLATVEGDVAMPATSSSTAHPGHRFRIRIAGIVSDHWSDRFAGVELLHSPEGDSLVSGEAIDTAALFGVLRTVETLGAHLISIVTWPANGGRG
jgi:hypothetical protein